MTGSATSSASANVWFAARAPEPLPALPPGKMYGPRIGGWGPYDIIDDPQASKDTQMSKCKHATALTEEQIKHMVDRFLGWRLPETFNPDGGIGFKRTFNDHLPTPMKHDPSGTNLFDAGQADAMVRYMIEGLPNPQPASPPDLIERLCRALAFHTIESELTLSNAEGDLDEWAGECRSARALISESRFDIDRLYPISDRPTSTANPPPPEQVEWPPKRSARGLTDGARQNGSTGLLYEARNGVWVRV